MYTFNKKERLKNRKNITFLFEKGYSFFIYPFKVYYLFNQAEENLDHAAVLFSVGKKQFKHAVDRNRVKRLCRETYRLNKSILIEKLKEKKISMEVAFVYVGKTEPDFHELEFKMQKILAHLAELEKNST